MLQANCKFEELPALRLVLDQRHAVDELISTQRPITTNVQHVKQLHSLLLSDVQQVELVPDMLVVKRLLQLFQRKFAGLISIEVMKQSHQSVHVLFLLFLQVPELLLHIFLCECQRIVNDNGGHQVQDHQVTGHEKQEAPSHDQAVLLSKRSYPRLQRGVTGNGLEQAAQSTFQARSKILDSHRDSLSHRRITGSGARLACRRLPLQIAKERAVHADNQQQHAEYKLHQ
mmetsp:Transcript_7634/g.18062  ORF Transcript_7634/g.18062 Transcript_7634/m.18062 type:complete len:229 (-) Transcript_7634:824-1510(-)